MVEKRKDKPCNHEESINFLCQDNPSYFTTTYINGNKSWPRSCFHCSIEFGSGYKVNNKHPVMMCENAAKHDHECMCAMCIHCYNKMQSNEEYPSRRTRRSRNKLSFFIYICFYILLLLYISGPASTIKEKLLRREKTFTFGKI